MTRVLLICPEPLLHEQPAGIGVRFLEMARVLRDDGHEVVTLSPDSGLTPQSLEIETERAGVAVVQGHAANDLFAHGRPLPTVVDLYDPFIVENLHYYAQRGAEVFTHDHATLIQSLVRGDYFLCASKAQRLFYLGMLMATGRVNPALFEHDPRLDSLIAIAPFGVHKMRFRARARNESNAILFGGVYDWYDPVVAIDAVALARESLPEVTLTFTHHPNPELTPQGRAGVALEHARKNRYDFVHFEPWVPYAQRGDFFDRFALALLTFSHSLETDLAMRTRIYDYLWGGLPVITSSAPGTDEILTRYDAGSVIAPLQAEAFSREIVRLLQDRSRLERMRSGSERFVRDHQWTETLAPLREFCLHPQFDSTREAFAVPLQVPARPRTIFERLRRRIGEAF